MNLALYWEMTNKESTSFLADPFTSYYFCNAGGVIEGKDLYLRLHSALVEG